MVALLSGGLWLRTKLPGDAASIAADRAEVGMLDRLQAENKELRETVKAVYEDRNNLILKLGEATGAMKGMEIKYGALEQTVADLKDEVSRLRTDIAQRKTP